MVWVFLCPWIFSSLLGFSPFAETVKSSLGAVTVHVAVADSPTSNVNPAVNVGLHVPVAVPISKLLMNNPSTSTLPIFVIVKDNSTDSPGAGITGSDVMSSEICGSSIITGKSTESLTCCRNSS